MSNEEKKATKPTQSAQLRKYRASYQAYQQKSGEISLDNGDDVASLLRGCSVEDVMALADKVKAYPDGWHQQRYAKVNKGSKRMNAGNVIRGAHRRGEETVTSLKRHLRAIRNA